MAAILIVEDEPVLMRSLKRTLEVYGHDVRAAENGETGLKVARDDPPDLVLLDLRLPDRSGLDLLADLRSFDPALPVVVMTAYGSVADAVEAMRRGAADYVQKPLDLDKLRIEIARILSHQRRERELIYLRERERTLPRGMLGRDASLLSIFEQAERLRKLELPPRKRPTMLLTGETGTGKGLIARAIHEHLGGGPFIELNCSAMPASLIEAELFGHERGSFTDAKTSRPGLFEAADGGAIFLDEIADLDPAFQAKFLKVIEDKRVRRLGSTRDRELNCHVLAATNRDLAAQVREGRFREDLLHRLRVLCFEIPPLRERGQDAVLLARHFCAEVGQQYGGSARRLSSEAEALIARYPWPGNVRELRNVIERAVLLDPRPELGVRTFAQLLEPATAAASGTCTFPLPKGGIDLETLERDLIQQALEHTERNQTRAAALLGLTRDTLRYRMEKHGLR